MASIPGPGALLDVSTRVTGVPVVPDAETARRWAHQELADPIYHQRPNLVQIVWEWVLRQLAEIRASAASLDALGLTVVAVTVLLAVVVIALLVAGPVRRARIARRAPVAVLGDDVRSAAELRASADALAGQERWSEAVLDRFRAMIRSLEDRAILDDRPGRTAHEAADLAAVRLPSCGTGLTDAARLFDAVCYGDVAAGPDDDARLRELDARLAATRPLTVGGPRAPQDEAVLR